MTAQSNTVHDHESVEAGAPGVAAAAEDERDERDERPVFSLHERRQARRLILVIALVSVFFVVQMAGAILAESVVLQADALHLLMDVLALSVSLFAMRLAVRKPTRRFTFGLRRAEPVAAIFSAGLVLVTTVLIVIEGIEALRGHSPPKAGVMLVVALVAVVVHGLSAWLLHDVVGHAHPGEGGDHDPPPGHPHSPAAFHEHAHEHPPPHDHSPDHASHDEAPRAHDHSSPHGGPHDEHAAHAEASHPPGSALQPKAHGHALNLRGAWLHLAGDALGAMAALVAALVIRFGGPPAADPIASFVVAAILLVGSIRLLLDATLVLLEAAPPHLPVAVVGQLVRGFPGVAAVNQLHVWTLGAGHDAITVHVRSRAADPSLGERLSARLRAVLGAEYITVQVDSGDPARRGERKTPRGAT